MISPQLFNNKLKFMVVATCMTTLLAALVGFGLLKKTIVFLLVKLYEVLIKLNPFSA